MDETGAHYTEWSKPERQRPIQYTNAYIRNLKRLTFKIIRIKKIDLPYKEIELLAFK